MLPALLALSALGALFILFRKPDNERGGFAQFSSRELASGPGSGRALAASLPPVRSMKEIPDRDAMILAMAGEGLIPEPEWQSVTYTKDGHEVTFSAALRPLMLGEIDPVLVTVRHDTAQQLADLFEAMLPTTRLADMAYAAAKHIPKQNQTPDALMASTERMILHSDNVAKALAAAGIGPNELARDLGKDWVNTEQLLTPDGHIANARDESRQPIPGTIAAANFGWHEKGSTQVSPGGSPVIQAVGLRHSIEHTDYSQVVTLYGKHVSIEGVLMPAEVALRDPALAYLLSDEVQRGQAARVWRHPAVPEGGVA